MGRSKRPAPTSRRRSPPNPPSSPPATYLCDVCKPKMDALGRRRRGRGRDGRRALPVPDLRGFGYGPPPLHVPVHIPPRRQPRAQSVFPTTHCGQGPFTLGSGGGGGGGGGSGGWTRGGATATSSSPPNPPSITSSVRRGVGCDARFWPAQRQHAPRGCLVNLPANRRSFEVQVGGLVEAEVVQPPLEALNLPVGRISPGSAPSAPPAARRRRGVVPVNEVGDP